MQDYGLMIYAAQLPVFGEFLHLFKNLRTARTEPTFEGDHIVEINTKVPWEIPLEGRLSFSVRGPTVNVVILLWDLSTATVCCKFVGTTKAH